MKIYLPKSKKSKILTALIALLGIILLGGGAYALNNSFNTETASETTSTSIEPEYLTDTSQDEKPIEEPVVTPTPPVTSNTDSKPPATAPARQWPVQLTSARAALLTAVVNKKHKLPSTYVPSLTNVSGGQLRTEAANAFNTMVNAASSAGVQLAYGSGYRSYFRQQQLYNNYVAQDGQAAADTYSARPGHSEHQTGLAVDVKGDSCYLQACFANTVAGKWVAANAHNYGFVIRYPSGKESVTGYQYEPWHLRFIGIDVAKEVYGSGKTLEEYYGIPGGGYN